MPDNIAFQGKHGNWLVHGFGTIGEDHRLEVTSQHPHDRSPADRD